MKLFAANYYIAGGFVGAALARAPGVWTVSSDMNVGFPFANGMLSYCVIDDFGSLYPVRQP